MPCQELMFSTLSHNRLDSLHQGALMPQTNSAASLDLSVDMHDAPMQPLFLFEDVNAILGEMQR